MGNEECSFYESINAVLQLPVPDEEKKARLEQLGVKSTLLNAIHLQLSEKAAAGDVQAAKYLRDIAMTPPQGRDEVTQVPEGFDLTTLTDDELRSIAAHAAAGEA